MKSCLTEFNEKKYEAMVRKELAEQYSEQLKEKDRTIEAVTAEKDAKLKEKDAEIKSLKEQLAKLQKQ